MSRKGENIYKRKDNRWEARYIKGYRENGKAYYGYCYAKSYKEAKRKVTVAKAELLSEKKKAVRTEKKLFSQFCDEWLLLNRDRIKESSYAKYSNILAKHIKPNLGGVFLQAVSSAMIENFSHTLLCEDGLAPKTVKDILTVLGSVMKYASKQMHERDIVADIVYPKLSKAEERVLTREEQDTFVEYLLKDTDRYKFGILFSLYTGIRIGELCALQWKNISITERTVSVTKTMQRVRNFEHDKKAKTKILLSEPKSNRSMRVIPLTNNAIELCKAQLPSEPEAYVLTGNAEKYIEPRVMQYHLKKYTQECGLEGVHFHTLRHTFATRCVEVDFEIKSLSEILGHSSASITMDRYVHSSIELKRENMNKLASIGY